MPLFSRRATQFDEDVLTALARAERAKSASSLARALLALGAVRGRASWRDQNRGDNAGSLVLLPCAAGAKPKMGA